MDQFLRTKTTISQKIKIRKLILHLFRHIPHLSCKYDYFWNFLLKNILSIWQKKKKLVEGFAPHTTHQVCAPGSGMFSDWIPNLTGWRLYQFHKNFHVPSSLLTTVEYKIDHISKTKNRTKNSWTKNPFKNIAHLFGLWFFLGDTLDKMMVTQCKHNLP